MRRDANKNAKATYKLNDIANKWLSLVNNMKVKMTQMKDELTAESNARFLAELNYQEQLAVEKELQLLLAKIQEIRWQIKREKPVGRRGGRSRWPVHVMMLIYELRMNGTPPSAVPKNIQTHSAYFTG